MKQLTIYFTSDIHGYIYPTDYRDHTKKPLGFLNVIQNFKKDGNTLIIDGGDTIQGSPFTTFISKNPPAIHPIATLMNTAQYDYVTLGNHDFNYGYHYLKTYLNPLHAQALCTNVIDTKGELSILPHAIHTLDNHIKVGIIGFTTDFISIWENPVHLKHFTITDTFSSIQSSFEKLRAQVDYLIGIYHGGFEYDLQYHTRLSSTSENIGYTLCQNYDFDLLLTAHQHLSISNQSLFGTHIVQTSHNGTHFAKVDIQFNHSSICTTSSIVPVTVNYSSLLYNELLPLEEAVQTWLDQPVGTLDTPLLPDSHLSMAIHGSAIANFINQIQLESSGADLSCCSLANSVKGFDSSVTVRDIVSTYIYPNTLVVLEVTGDILKHALENTATYFSYENDTLCIASKFLTPKPTHYNYDYFSNIFYTIDVTQPIGHRITSVKFKNKEIASTDCFTLVMNNYRQSGAGGYDLYRKCKVIKEITTEMPEIIINYFTKHPHVIVDSTQYFHVITPSNPNSL